MAEQAADVSFEETSPEAIAYRLMVDVLRAEGTSLAQANRAMILNTYAQCLITVRDPETRGRKRE